MKQITTVIALIAISATFSACSKKCVKCTHAYFADSNLCRDDFDTQEDYDSAIEVAENVGYDCN